VAEGALVVLVVVARLACLPPFGCAGWALFARLRMMAGPPTA
jgi:hypothetical protein